MEQLSIREELVKKWGPVLEATGAPAIQDAYRKEVTAVLLENMTVESDKARQAMLYEGAPTNAVGSYPDTGGFAKFDPVLVSMVRRAAPKMIAFDICGVQPMTQPSGLIFAMKSRYGTQGGTEALFDEADTDYSGTGTHAGSNPVSGTFTTGSGLSTSAAERLGQGGTGDGTFNSMAFSIEKVPVNVKTRALKADYSVELAQDMRTVHGLNAEQELTNILSTEILSEINREVIRTIYYIAKPGAQVGTTTAGTFDLDLDSNGRWVVEKFKGMLFQIEREANAIYQQTRRGRGNFILCSADVASALAMSGVLDYAPALSTNLNVDEANTTFAGVLQGKYKVFIDPYAANQGTSQFFLAGYKGISPWDAGFFYCPYVPLQLMRATDPNSFQPKIGFKTRYAVAVNPLVDLDDGGAVPSITADKNYYYRRVAVTNLM